MSSNSNNGFLALLAGAAIGVGLGILFAPDKGSKTREKIKEGYDEAKDNFVHKFEDISHQLKNKFAGSKHDFEESFEDLVSSMSHKTEDVISFLEIKLAELKEKNAKLQKKELAGHNHEK